MGRLGCDNCNGNSMRLSGRGGIGAAPSWYDNLYNEASGAAENLWNDVESAGVWVGNTIGNWGNNAAGAEDQAMYADPSATMANPGGATAAGVSNFESGVQQDIIAPIENFVKGIFSNIFLIGVAGVAVYLIATDKD